MRRLLYIPLVLLAVVASAACAPKHGGKTSNIPYVDYSADYVDESETVNVPFTVQGGVKYVTASINGMSTDMIFDTGCSQTMISINEARQLASRGLLEKTDYLGRTQAVIADGSIVEDDVFNIRSIELSDGIQKVVCRNVEVQVSSSVSAPVLLGNAVLDRVASYTIDNDENVIRFKLR